MADFVLTRAYFLLLLLLPLLMNRNLRQSRPPNRSRQSRR